MGLRAAVSDSTGSCTIGFGQTRAAGFSPGPGSFSGTAGTGCSSGPRIMAALYLEIHKTSSSPIINQDFHEGMLQ